MRHLALLLCLLAPLTHAGSNSMSILNGLIEIELPAGIEPMTPAMKHRKYPHLRPPAEAYSNAEGSVSFVFHHTANGLLPGEITRVHAAMSDSFRRRYPKARWYRDETVKLFGRQVFRLELVTQAADAPVHNLIYGMSVAGRLLLLTFNAVSGQRERWLAAGRKALASLRIISPQTQ